VKTLLRTNIYSYYSFGYNYYLLRHDTEGYLVRSEDNDSRGADDNADSLEELIDEFLERIDSLSLPVTSEAASDLRNLRERLGSMPKGKVVDDDLAEEITEACNRLDVTLDSELKLRSAFVVTPKRFEQQHLLETPWQLLASDTWSKLSTIAQFDISSGCRAIAFGMPTAAAFHFMRCVEAMLRDYYSSIVKRDRVDPLMWSPMIQHLRKRRDAPPRATLDHLDNIRANFRNPTQHPEARYELEEAQDLLAVSVDILNRMVRDLGKRQRKS
jgi:hypothetical protein